MKRYLTFLSLAALMAFVTGCPRNEYIVELTPRGDVLARQLTFYRADGTDTNGLPKYQDFPGVELAAIQVQYPPGAVKAQGKRHVARAEFASAMPTDVGGAGNWTNYTTSLGSAAFYLERFRGNDDLATISAKRLAAMDQLTDLLIGWSRAELGQEPQYETLRKFLDGEFRRDMKNFSLYLWAGAMAGTYHPKAEEEFAVRFGQYLVERGYLKLGQLPELYTSVSQNDFGPLLKMIQQLVAQRMGLPVPAPLPAALAFLADDQVASASFEKYLASSDLYHARLKQWQDEKKTNPDAPEPKPMELAAELIGTALDWNLMGSPTDRLTVKLALPAEPLFTNGKWDSTNHLVLWETELDDKELTARLPTLCFATWTTVNDSFQKNHFGRVILDGEELLRYCLWRGSLNGKQGAEWEALLDKFKANEDPTNALAAFSFTGETKSSGDKPAPASALGKEILKEALVKTPESSGK